MRTVPGESTADALLYPDEQRAAQLVNEFCGVLSQLTCVRRVALFGSRAQGEADRWSDIDVLVVTEFGPEDYWRVFSALRQHKPMLHHHIFIPESKPAGGSVLGILFEGESVFHNVDLNFMRETDAASATNLARFGPLRWLDLNHWEQPTTLETAGPTITDLVQHVDDKRIGDALHWTKKAVKGYLRGRGTLAVVSETAQRLDEVMRDFPEDVRLPTGNICHPARQYLAMAERVGVREGVGRGS